MNKYLQHMRQLPTHQSQQQDYSERWHNCLDIPWRAAAGRPGARAACGRRAASPASRRRWRPPAGPGRAPCVYAWSGKSARAASCTSRRTLFHKRSFYYSPFLKQWYIKIWLKSTHYLPPVMPPSALSQYNVRFNNRIV